jgi:hypothetical protein
MAESCPDRRRARTRAANSTAKDRAEALYGIISKHPEPEDVLFAMMHIHRNDASNAYKAALQAVGVIRAALQPIMQQPAIVQALAEATQLHTQDAGIDA